jgi:DNA-binding NtrC family response regulator
MSIDPAHALLPADGATEEDDRRGGARAALVSRRYLFVALECDRPLSGGARFALAGVDRIVVGRGTARTVERVSRDGGRQLLLTLPAPSLSAVHAHLDRAPEGWRIEDAGSRNGCYLNGQRVKTGLVRPGDVLEVGRVFLFLREFSQRPDERFGDADDAGLDSEQTALSTLLPSLSPRLDMLTRAARSNVTVLLWGETGTGKELLARAVHALSSPRPGPFVAVNCGALTDSIAGSELFGHVRGAFSGAVNDAIGYVRAAHGGTLLLDEVGDLSPAVQGALLRVLQEREVVAVGSARPHKVDVRFIATSPRPLDREVERGRFRADLHARLTGYVHATTPLRQRIEDIGVLVAALLHKQGVTEGDRPRLAPELGLDLLRHSWPNNVRQLEHALARAWLLAEDGLMTDSALEAATAPAAEGPGSGGVAGAASGRRRPASPAEEELRADLVERLAAARGNVSRVARDIGKGRVHLHRLMKRLDIDPRRYRA